MLKDKRKSSVVLALLAFFCTAAATYVAVEWKRVGGSLIALVKGKDDKDGKGDSNRAVAASMASNVAVAKAPAVDFMPLDEPGHEPEVALLNTRRHVASVGSGSGSFKGNSEDDLFKDGDPAAGVPPGKFIVAQNDTPSAPAERGPDTGGGIDGPGVSGVVSAVTGPAPAPTGNGGIGGGGLLQPSTPVASPPAGTPPAGSPPAPATPPAPISSIPEASSLAMMTLGSLFLAVAAARRRNQA